MSRDEGCLVTGVSSHSGAADLKTVFKKPYTGLHRAWGLQGGWGSQISRQSAYEGGRIVSPTHRPPLPPSKCSWHSFLLETELTPGPQCGRKDYINEKFQWHLPAFRAVPQPTAPPPRAPTSTAVFWKPYVPFTPSYPILPIVPVNI
jgi:hypothetical protein